jgi:hypothetical protein
VGSLPSGPSSYGLNYAEPMIEETITMRSPVSDRRLD